MPEVLTSPTVVAVIVSALLTSVLTYFTARISGSRTAAQAAASTEVTVRAQFVTDLTARVRDLESRLDAAAKRERELVERYRVDTESLDRRYRHLVGQLVMRERALRRIIEDHGIRNVPPFRGWEQFVEEGGQVREEWVDDHVYRHPRGQGRILVADDNQEYASALQRMLTNAGYEVNVAHRGEQALQCLVGEHYDAALLDIVLPDIDGAEVFRRARAAGVETPMIAVSGSDQAMKEAQPESLGFSSTLLKPVRMNELVLAIRSATGEGDC